MEVTIHKPDGTVTHVSGTPEEIKDFFGVTDLPKSSDETEGLEPGVYVVADGWTPDYLTTGKYYPIYGDSRPGAEISCDDGSDIYICYEDSTHLKGGNWRKVVVE
jgi:hypothetical protein